MRYLAALAVVLAGCGDTGLSTGACKGLDEAQCNSRSDCKVGTCAPCGGSGSFAGCYDPATDQAPPCPAIACAPLCNGLTESACKMTGGCRADYCPTCTVAKQFTRCSSVGDVQVSCPALGCPQPPNCDTLTSEATCDARSDCHPVYRDPGTCLCAQPGCCAMFSACADGAQANCKGPALCKVKSPYCELPYVVAYTDTCYEGCVRQSDCVP